MVSGFFLFLETALNTPDTPKTPPTLSILLKNAGQVLHRKAARIAAFRACAAFLLLGVSELDTPFSVVAKLLEHLVHAGRGEAGHDADGDGR